MLSAFKQAPSIISRTMSSSASNTGRLQASKLFNLKGQTALVTGGGTGIGLMAAQALAANGVKVYITGRRLEALENAAKTHSPDELGGSIVPITSDIRDKDSIKKLVDEISSKEKFLNILVNNAGIAGPTNDTTKSTESAQALSDELWTDEFEQWQNVYATNVTSYYFLSVRCLPLLNAATQHFPGFSGAIINISSISGIIASPQHHFSYNASKAACIQLTQLMGKIFSEPGVKTVEVPGPTLTAVRRGISDEKEETFQMFWHTTQGEVNSWKLPNGHLQLAAEQPLRLCETDVNSTTRQRKY